jgi:hypothetical protein
MRKRIEELFGEAKAFMGLWRAKLRGSKLVKEQVLMTATAQNIKRMVKLLSKSDRRKATFAAQYPLILPNPNNLPDFFNRLPQNLLRILSVEGTCFAEP